MDLIDVAIQWIDKRDASYLCKEDKVVWFASITGREVDKDWQELNLAQLHRVLRHTLNDEITTKDIIGAFQELGKLYEMGTNSPFRTPEYVFNYSDNSPLDMVEVLIRELSVMIEASGIKGIRIVDINKCFDKICVIAQVDTSNQRRNRLYEKYFEMIGYALRAGANRVFYNGKKTTAILHKNYAPSTIRNFDSNYLNNMAAMVVAKVE